MATVLITGGTGLIGTALTKALLDIGYTVIILSRKKREQETGIRDKKKAGSTYILDQESRISYATWNVEEQTIDTDAIKKADYIVHLAGENFAEKRWSEKRKKQIAESRTRSSALLVKALKENENHVKAVVSASAVGWYGSSPLAPADEKEIEKDMFTETDPPAEDFFGQTCKEWEASIEPVTTLGKRLVKFRTGFVLSNKGGAFVEFKKPLRFGFATILGSGKQVVSWVHIDDLIRLYIFAIENEKLQGSYNAVAPHPVTNKRLVLQLARSTRGKFFVPVFVPSFILRIVLGEMSLEVLKSTTVSCEKIRRSGFTFLYPSITSAIHKLARKNQS